MMVGKHTWYSDTVCEDIARTSSHIFKEHEL